MIEGNKQTLLDRVDQAIELVRPHLLADGGNVELIDITTDMDVIIKWTGNCESCSMSVYTLKAALQETIRAHVPEIRSVIAQNGLNPVPSA